MFLEHSADWSPAPSTTPEAPGSDMVREPDRYRRAEEQLSLCSQAKDPDCNSNQVYCFQGGATVS